MLERRRWPRVALVAEITYAADSPPMLRQITDLSHGGLFVDTATPLPEETAVRIRFALPMQDMPMALEAKVAWMQPHIGMGLRFTKVSPAAKRAIDWFVEQTLGSEAARGATGVAASAPR